MQFFTSPDANYSISYSATALSVEDAIRNATWTDAGGAWTLRSDLSSLFDATLNRVTSVASPIDVAIGYRGSETVNAVSPEPSTLVLAGLGALAGLGYRWRRGGGGRIGERPGSGR